MRKCDEHQTLVHLDVSFIWASIKGLLLSWCAGVCDGTGKIEVRIGGGLVF